MVLQSEGAKAPAVWCGIQVWGVKEEERVFSIPIPYAATKVEMVDVDMLKPSGNGLYLADTVVDSICLGCLDYEAPAFFHVTIERRPYQEIEPSCSLNLVTSWFLALDGSLPPLVKLPTVRKTGDVSDELAWTFTNDHEEIDKLSVNVVQNLYFTRCLVEQNGCGSAENFDICSVRWNK